MTKSMLQKLAASMRVANEKIAELTPKEKKNLEHTWDVEHAYYSSTIEGSQIDKKDFEKLAKSVS